MNHNPYWTDIKAFISGGVFGRGDGHIKTMRSREAHYLSLKYGTGVVPAPTTISHIAQLLGPKAAQVAAGLGYWTWVLEREGVEMTAYEPCPPMKRFTMVHKSQDMWAVRAHRDLPLLVALDRHDETRLRKIFERAICTKIVYIGPHIDDDVTTCWVLEEVRPICGYDHPDEMRIYRCSQQIIKCAGQIDKAEENK